MSDDKQDIVCMVMLLTSDAAQLLSPASSPVGSACKLD